MGKQEESVPITVYFNFFSAFFFRSLSASLIAQLVKNLPAMQATLV